MLKERYGIHQTTLQVENFEPTMEECHTCRNVATPTRFYRFTNNFKNSFKFGRCNTQEQQMPSFKFGESRTQEEQTV